MTEYGRGTGPEPWHPDDPLYGDQGWTGHHAQTGHHPQPGQPAPGGQGSYPGPQQPHPYPDPQQYQQYAQQQYPDQQYPATGQYPDPAQYQDSGQYQGYPQEPGQPQQVPHPQYAEQHPTYAGGQQYPQDGWQQHPGDGTGTGAWQAAAADPFGHGPAGYPEETPDPYATEGAYPPPQPPGRRHLVPEPAGEWQDQQEPATDADAPDAGEPEEHAFFSGGGDDDGDDSEGRGGRSRRGGRGGGRKQKGRNGAACLIVSLVLVGGVGGIGYVGYDFLKTKFGPAEDYAGEGTGSVVVVVKPGSGLGEIGRTLKSAGVVKSAEAFVSAAQNSQKPVQPGTYTLKKEMSAASAVDLMVSGKAQNVVMVNPGDRNSKIYKLIDAQLKLSPGSTAAVAKKKVKELGLPAWALNAKDLKDPLEGFLYPQRYDLSTEESPEKLLKQMVAKAVTNYQSLGYDDAKAKSLGLKSPLELITVASLVQAEGANKPDYDKIARVVYNRLKPGNTETYGLLDFDSTVNYMRNSSTLNVGSVDEMRKVHDPYNTYWVHGLPAGPIGNPGEEALHSAVNPADGPWYYFVSLKNGKTLFAVTNEEQNRNRAQYQQEQQQSSGG